MTTSFHPTAIIEKGAQIGSGVKIGPYCMVGPNVTLQDRVTLHSHAVIEGHTTIGEDTEVYPFASLGTAPQDLKFGGEKSELKIGKRNRIREHVTMNPGTVGGGLETVVGDDGLFMVAVHIAHDCRIGNHVIMANNATLGGHVHVGDYAVLGGLSAVHQFVRIGPFAVIGGMSGVENDVIPYGRVKGERAFLAGLNLVGLERGGFTKEQIKTLQRAFYELFSDDGTMEQRLERVEKDYTAEELVMSVIRFAREKTRFPLCQPPKKASLTETLPARLALIAGGGGLPARFLQACDNQNIEVFVVGFENQTEETLFEGRQYMRTRPGAAGTIITTLRSHDIKDMVFLGSIRRPNLADMRPDLKTTAFFLKLGFKAIGDDGLLKAMRRELEQDGFRIHGAQKFFKDALTAEGPVGRVKPGKEHWADILHGAAIAREIGRLDIGQSVIVQDGMVLGVEGVEGTDELIRRCAGYRRKGRGAVLVKTAKPQQDRDLDLPVIGPETVRLCAEAGMAGIAVEAGQSMILDADGVAELANKHKMFVIGVDFNKPADHAA